jgi:hypothetical protein
MLVDVINRNLIWKLEQNPHRLRVLDRSLGRLSSTRVTIYWGASRWSAHSWRPHPCSTALLSHWTVCVSIHCGLDLSMCTHTTIQTRAWSRPVVDKMDTGTSFRESWHGSHSWSPAFHRGGLGSVLDESMWGLWWTKLHWDTFLSKYLGFPTVASLYQCPLTMVYPRTLYKLRIWQLCWMKNFSVSRLHFLISFVSSIHLSIFLFVHPASHPPTTCVSNLLSNGDIVLLNHIRWIWDLTIFLRPTNLEVDHSFLRFGTECCDRVFY